jgi:ribosomal protein L11 methyltransferase
MITPDDLLYIYEIRGDPGDRLPPAPSSFVGLWNEEEFVYLFFLREEEAYVRTVIGDINGSITSMHVMRYGDWQTGIPSRGMEIAGIEFVPTDHEDPPREAVLLDPSVVFGDGSHPTTIACLNLLRRIVGSAEVTSLLDLGTGTGILALAAIRMGVEHVVAVDKNRLAATVAVENVKLNGLCHAIEVREGEARLFIDKPFDVVAANLPFQVLRELCTLRGAKLHRFWIVSGVNEDQGEVLKELFAEQGYNIFHESASSPWVTFGMTGDVPSPE